LDSRFHNIIIITSRQKISEDPLTSDHDPWRR
jgi:hypothetical protein